MMSSGSDVQRKNCVNLVLNARETAFVGPNPPAEDQIRTDVESPLSSSPQPAQGGKEDV